MLNLSKLHRKASMELQKVKKLQKLTKSLKNGLKAIASGGKRFPYEDSDVMFVINPKSIPARTYDAKQRLAVENIPPNETIIPGVLKITDSDERQVETKSNLTSHSNSDRKSDESCTESSSVDSIGSAEPKRRGSKSNEELLNDCKPSTSGSCSPAILETNRERAYYDFYS